MSRNFVTSRVLAQGPLRVMFELDYAPFEAGPNVKVTETKRITLDAGNNFNRIASTFKVEGTAPRSWTSASASASTRTPTSRPTSSWMRTWEPLKDDDGSLGCAVVLPAGDGARRSAPPTSTRSSSRRRRPGAPFVYYMGSDWSKRPRRRRRRGAWTKAVQEQARDIASPVKVTLSAKK